MLVLARVVICDLYLFHLTVLLNPVFNCSKSLLSSSVDKVTTGAYNIVYFILNVALVGLLNATTAVLASGSASLVALLVKTQFSDQAKIKDTSQLVNIVSNVLKKLLKCFNDTIISTFSVSVLLPSNLRLMFVL